MSPNENPPDNIAPAQDGQPAISSNIVSTTTQKTTLAFSGPLPPPSILAAYNNIVPGAAERIIAIAEGEASHQREMDKFVLQQTFLERKLGQLFGFSIGVIGLLVSAFLAYTGHEVTAGVIAGTTIGSLVATFVVGKFVKDAS